MHYPELNITLPDAVMVIRDTVYCCFNPSYSQNMAVFAQPWYTMDDGDVVEDAFFAMELDYERNMVGIPIDWIDYTLIPPLHTNPKKS